jgi:hypothetical protein
MKTALISRKLITAVIALVILVYFVVQTTSPKIIFAPFLICSIASIGKNLGLLFHKMKIAWVFDRVFKIVFFLSWFAFLVVVFYIAVRDGNYKMIFFTLPFWLGGVFFAKRKLLDK